MTKPAPRIATTVQSVDRALTLLEAAAGHDGLGVTELARQVDLNVPTAHNLLRTLVAKNYLINRQGRYHLGPAAAALTARWKPDQVLPHLVQPALEKISQQSSETAVATILVGSQAHLVAVAIGTQPIIIQHVETRWPDPLRLATGRLLVAMTRQSQWDVLIQSHPDTKRRRDAAQWHQELQRVRDQGYCILHGQNVGGQLAMALPLRSRNQQIIAAVGVSCPAFRVDPDHAKLMFDALWQNVEGLSVQFGADAQLITRPQIDWASAFSVTRPEVAAS